jgi:hypothetical protein
MLDVIGALFLVGLGTTILTSIVVCGQIGILQVLKYGSIWTLFPSIVFLVTGEKYLTTLSIWIPTFLMVNQMLQLCSQEAEEDCVDE